MKHPMCVNQNQGTGVNYKQEKTDTMDTVYIGCSIKQMCFDQSFHPVPQIQQLVFALLLSCHMEPVRAAQYTAESMWGGISVPIMEHILVVKLARDRPDQAEAVLINSACERHYIYRLHKANFTFQ